MDAVSSISPSSCLVPLRPDGPCQLDSRDSSGSGVVADSLSPGARYFVRSGVPSARLLVRRLGLGLGVHLGEEVASGLWSREEAALSIKARELLAIENALLFFALQISNSLVAVFADKSKAIAYLRNQGGTRSQLLNAFYGGRSLFRWCWLHNSLWIGTVSWRIPFPGSIRSWGRSGL